MENIKSTIKEEVYVKGPFTFAKVTDKVGRTTITGIGFSKWDNDTEFPYTKEMGETIAKGRAHKELKKQRAALEAKAAKRSSRKKVTTEVKTEVVEA